MHWSKYDFQAHLGDAHYALQQHFEGATVVSLAVDATTLGSLDTLSGVLLSKHPLEETFRAGWAPPQATCGPYGR